MARMKIEFLNHYHRQHGLKLKDRLVAWLPRYAPWGVRLGFLLNLRDRLPGLPWLSEKLLGYSARRPLPRWRRDVFNPEQESARCTSDRGRGGFSDRYLFELFRTG
jgi:hypothetical protein